MVEDLFKTEKSLDLKKHGDIYYLIMNQKDNNCTLEWMNEFNNLLDQVEQTKGPGALVTVSTSQKIYHTGFNLDRWKSDHLQQYESFAIYQHLIARLLTFPMPTMTAINGHAYAGGLIFALAHDFRTMNANYGYLCLSEINLDFPIPLGLSDFMRAVLTPNTLREIQYGGRFTAQRSLEMQMINKMYKDRNEMMEQIKEFEKEYAPKGQFRESTRDMKINFFYDAYQRLLQNPLSIQGIRRVARMGK